MTWFAVDDGFPAHRKVERLQGMPVAVYSAAITVWTLLGADCAARLTDGEFTYDRARKVSGLPAKDLGKAIDALLEVRLLERSEEGFRLHDWADYQRTREQVLAARNATKQRVARWRNGVTNGVTNGVSNGVGNASPLPAPPSPSQKREAPGASGPVASPPEAPPGSAAPPRCGTAEEQHAHQGTEYLDALRTGSGGWTPGPLTEDELSDRARQVLAAAALRGLVLAWSSHDCPAWHRLPWEALYGPASPVRLALHQHYPAHPPGVVGRSEALMRLDGARSQWAVRAGRLLRARSRRGVGYASVRQGQSGPSPSSSSTSEA